MMLSAAVCLQKCKKVNAMSWTQDEAIAYECAREVVTDLIGIHSGQIAEEKKKSQPDVARIQALDAERQRIFQERRALRVEDSAEVARIRTEYGAVVRAWRAKQKTLDS